MQRLFFEQLNTYIKVAVAACVVAVAYAAVPVGAAPVSENNERYIVVLKDTVKDSKSVANEHAKNRGAKVSVVYSHALKGYAAKMTAASAKELAKDPRVAFVEPDGIATASAVQSAAPWGLDRIDQRSRTLSSTFNYVSTGANVTSYVIDTGIRTTHADFGGRAVDGYDAIDGSLPADDCNGHGTHVAGTVGGSTYGVAKDTKLVSVRVLGCDGSGSWSGVIAGIDYVTANHQAGTPAVANMSLSGGATAAVDTAVKNSILDGVSYALAAGNSSTDACSSSPARVAEAMTVGATTKTDAKASFSNYGRCLDWFAPGVDIASAWYTSDAAVNTISGTSMASPHTAGVAVLYLQKYPTATPKQVRDNLYNQTTKYSVSSSKTSKNHLLFTNY